MSARPASTVGVDGGPGVDYPDFFHREMTPTWLRSATTALGHRCVPTGQPFVWMELGCGAGMGALLTAAAHPEGRFIGVDIDPGHIAVAKERAASTGVANVEFVHDDVVRMAQAADDAWPQCDFIVLHGVYAWVTEATRAAIREVVRRQLKPGGLVYVAYMSHPGSSGLAAAQRLMRQVAAQGAGGAVRQSLDVLRRLEQSGAGYFAATPEMGRQLAHMEREEDAYLAHEFLSADWQPLHVADVMRDFGEVGCGYVGSATLIENIDAVSIPAGVQDILRDITDPALAQTVRDMARNQSLRRDIYQRSETAGSHRLSADEHRTQLLQQTIAAAPGAPVRGPLRLDTRIGVVEAPDAWFTPLLQALTRGAGNYAGLLRLQPYAGQPGFLNQAFQTLFWAGCAHPVRTVSLPSTELTWRLNAWLGQEAGTRRWLLAPVLATALEVAPWQGAIACTLIRDPDLRGSALAAKHPEIAAATIASFEADILPRWIQYRIVPPAAAPVAT